MAAFPAAPCLLLLGLQGSLLTAGQRRTVPGRPGRAQPAVMDGGSALQVVKQPDWTLFNRQSADKGDAPGEKKKGLNGDTNTPSSLYTDGLRRHWDTEGGVIHQRALQCEQLSTH